MQVTIEDEERILSLDEQFILIDCSSFEYLFGQQHESSIFVIRSFHSLSDQPFYTVHTILRASRHGREREREDEQEKEQERRERENNYSAIVTTANQNTYTFIHTDAYTSISLLQIIRSRSRTRTLLRVKKRKSMPADRFAPYPLPAHISHSEYRKVREYHEKEIDD